MAGGKKDVTNSLVDQFISILTWNWERKKKLIYAVKFKPYVVQKKEKKENRKKTEKKSEVLNFKHS